MDQRRGMSPFTAGMTGLLIGAVGAAIGITMADENNRKKVQTKAKTLANWGNKKVQELKKTSTESMKTISDGMSDMSQNGSKGGRTNTKSAK